MFLQPGQVLARDYRVVRPLAQGGMGKVYLVEQLSTGKQRALKVMHPEFASDEASRARFAQEARAGARIKSEHVVEVVAAGVDDQTHLPWIAMELLDGEELGRRVRRAGHLPPGEVLELFRQLVHGLGEAHRLGLVHRDLKPENLFVAVARRDSTPFTLKILDFGIARLAQESQAMTAGTRPVGTPRWMAPEQSEERARITPATDVWALGLLAFHLLTGRYYWRAANSDSSLTTLMRELVLEPLEPASVRAAALGAGPAIPPGFDAWFSRCVVREQESRFPDADAALRALVPLLESAAPWTPSAPALAPARTPDLGDPGDGATLPEHSLPPVVRPAPGGLRARPLEGAYPLSPGEGGKRARPQQGAAREHGSPTPAPGTSTGQAADGGGSQAKTLPASGGNSFALPLGLLFLALLGGSCWLLFAHRRAPAQATLPAALEAAARDPASFVATFESIPPGAALYEGETKLGETPLQLTLQNAGLREAPRRFRLIKEGYLPYSLLQGPSSEAVKIAAALAPEPAPPESRAVAPRAAKSRRGAGPDAEPAGGGDAPELRLKR